MEIKKLKVNFEDDRGTITDIFVKSPKEHITVISSKKGAVRGKHYHKLSTQYAYIVYGEMRCIGQQFETGKVIEANATAGDLIKFDPFEIHTFIARADTLFLVCVDGLRGGESYEKDTYRVSEELIKI